MEVIRSRSLSEGTIWHFGCLAALYLSQGISSGFLLALTTFLVESRGASLAEISLLLSITMIPWTLKIFFGPLVDSVTIKRYGRRRFWILSSQLLMILILVPLIFVEVQSVSSFLILIFTLHNLCVAVCDIAVDALAADSLKGSDLGKANGLMWGSKILGRGAGMLLSSSILFSFGIGAGILFLVCAMSLLLFFPLLSSELSYKTGMAYKHEFRNFLGIKFLFSEIIKGLGNKSALAAILFMLFSNIGNGIFDVIYNEFYIEVVGISGAAIGSLRPWGMWVGGLAGLFAGILSLYFDKRNLLLFFVTGQALVFLALSTFDGDTSTILAASAIISLDILDAGWKVIIFAILMALCTTQTSATNFGVFVGCANLSTVLGNNVVLVIMEYASYSGAFLFAAASTIPCVILTRCLNSREVVQDIR